MNANSLQQWIQHPEVLNRNTLYELRNLVSRYPYFETIRLLYLKNLYLLQDASFGTELRKAVLYVTDRRVLFYLIEGDKYVLPHGKQVPVPNLSVDEPSLDRTLTLINAFLATVPDESARPSTLDYAADYTGYLLQENTEESEKVITPLRGQELIDGFIEKSENDPAPLFTPSPWQADEDRKEDLPSLLDIPDSQAEEEEEDSYLTETLAKIYIKQQRYDKAIEIIKKLSLKYPKKNAYFADQIRFLEKLIINAKSK